METFALVLKDSEEKYTTTLSEILDTIDRHQNEVRRRLAERMRPGNDSSTSGQLQQQPEVKSNGVVKAAQPQRMVSTESKQVRKALRSILVTQGPML